MKPSKNDNWERPEIFIQQGHFEAVNSVALSPDEKYVATGSGGLLVGRFGKPALILWDAGSGREIHRFGGVPSRVKGIVFSPDGSHLLTGGASVDMWETFSGRHRIRFKGHSGLVFSVALGPEGKYAVSGGNDKTIRLWDVATGENLRTFRGHGDVVCSVAFDSDGQHVLSGSWDGTMRLWDLSGKLIRLFKRHDAPGLGVRIDGKKYGIEKYKEARHRPDLIRNILKSH